MTGSAQGARMGRLMLDEASLVGVRIPYSTTGMAKPFAPGGELIASG